MKLTFKHLIFSISLLLIGCKNTSNNVTNTSMPILNSKKPLSILLGTDLHYLTPSLSDFSDKFIEVINKGDGKIVHYTDNLVDGLISKAIDSNADFLILSGDLTFNGEKESHISLAKKLTSLQTLGTRVLVIPGNHDINSNFSYSYFDDDATKVENISSSEFKNIYYDFGYKNAISKDKNSFSYIYPLREDLYAIFLDSNTDKAKNSLNAKTLTWLEKSLESFDSNIKYISVTHQNILQHNSLLTEGYVIKNSNKLLDLYNKYNVSLNLTGHIHIQHIESLNNLNEIATGALASYPNNFSTLNIDSESNLTYKTEGLKVQTQSLGEEEFYYYSKNFFDTLSYNKSFSKLDEYEYLSFEEKNIMSKFITLINNGYFSGNLYENIDELMLHEGYSLWINKGESLFFNNYLKSILEDELINNNYFETSLK